MALDIGVFTSQYPYPGQFDSGLHRDYFCSGAERVAKRIAEYLASEGHRVHAFTSSKTSASTVETQNGVSVRRYGSVSSFRSATMSHGLVYRPLGHDLDVVHVHNGMPTGVVAGHLYSKINGVPAVVTHHGGDGYEPTGGLVRRGGLYLYYSHIYRRVLAACEAVTVPSEGYVQRSELLSGLTDRVSVIPNGVDLESFGETDERHARERLDLPTDAFVVLFMGSHRKRKGPQILLDAFEAFRADHPQSVLIMAGTGPLTEQLREMAASRGLPVRFPGFVPERQKSRYYAAADVYALPSPREQSEVFPLSILEAGACSTPVVVSDLRTIRSVVEGYDNPIRVPPGDVEALADTLRDLASSERRRDRCASEIHDFARDHRWSEIGDQYETLLTSLATPTSRR